MLVHALAKWIKDSFLLDPRSGLNDDLVGMCCSDECDKGEVKKVINKLLGPKDRTWATQQAHMEMVWTFFSLAMACGLQSALEEWSKGDPVQWGDTTLESPHFMLVKEWMLVTGKAVAFPESWHKYHEQDLAKVSKDVLKIDTTNLNFHSTLKIKEVGANNPIPMHFCPPPSTLEPDELRRGSRNNAFAVSLDIYVMAHNIQGFSASHQYRNLNKMARPSVEQCPMYPGCSSARGNEGEVKFESEHDDKECADLPLAPTVHVHHEVTLKAFGVTPCPQRSLDGMYIREWQKLTWINRDPDSTPMTHPDSRRPPLWSNSDPVVLKLHPWVEEQLQARDCLWQGRKISDVPKMSPTDEPDDPPTVVIIDAIGLTLLSRFTGKPSQARGKSFVPAYYPNPTNPICADACVKLPYLVEAKRKHNGGLVEEVTKGANNHVKSVHPFSELCAKAACCSSQNTVYIVLTDDMDLRTCILNDLKRGVVQANRHRDQTFLLDRTGIFLIKKDTKQSKATVSNNVAVLDVAFPKSDTLLGSYYKKSLVDLLKRPRIDTKAAFFGDKLKDDPYVGIKGNTLDMEWNCTEDEMKLLSSIGAAVCDETSFASKEVIDFAMKLGLRVAYNLRQDMSAATIYLVCNTHQSLIPANSTSWNSNKLNKLELQINMMKC